MQDKIKSPDTLIRDAWKRIDKRYLYTFLSTVICGLIAHLYMFTNKLPNYDDLSNLNSFGASGTLGRWGLAQMGNLATDLQICYSLPLINGLLSLFIIAISACLIVHIFHIKETLICAMVGVIMIVFPAWTATFFFMFTSVFYACSILLAVLSVFFLQQKKWFGIIASVILLCGSISIYQSYFLLTAQLILMTLCFQFADPNETRRSISLYGLKCIGCLLGSLIVYFIFNKFYLFHTHQTMQNHSGLDQFGPGSLTHYFHIDKIIRTYERFFSIFMNNSTELFPYKIITFFNILLLFSFLIQYAYFIKKACRGILNKIGFTLCFLLIPPVMFSLYLVVPESEIYSIMLYPVVGIYILFLLFADKMSLCESNASIVNLGKILVTVVLSGIILFYIHFANAQYLSIDFSIRQAEGYYTAMISAIKHTEGYRDEYDVIFIGNEITDLSFYNNIQMAPYKLSGRSETLLNIYSRDYFLREYIGFYYISSSNEDISAYREALSGMPCYPDDGSIKVIGDKILIKLEDPDT